MRPCSSCGHGGAFRFPHRVLRGENPVAEEQRRAPGNSSCPIFPTTGRCAGEPPMAQSMSFGSRQTEQTATRSTVRGVSLRASNTRAASRAPSSTVRSSCFATGSRVSGSTPQRRREVRRSAPSGLDRCHVQSLLRRHHPEAIRQQATGAPTR
jgi:hypothetical protein